MADKEKTYYTDAIKRANLKYQREKLKRVGIWVQKGTDEDWKRHAELMGDDSLSAFVKRAVAETMDRDRQRIKDALKNAPKENAEEE